MRDAEVRQAPRGREHALEVQERLAHPHVHAVVDLFDTPEVQRLVQDLGRGEVAAEAHASGGAERARERAARLSGDADRPPPVAIPHEHGFDRVTVVCPEERLDGAVAGLPLVDDVEGRERDRVGQKRSQALRQGRHLVVRGGAACRPVPDLSCPVPRLAAIGKRLLEERKVHGRRTVASAT
jgi:hypothetical protein